MWVCEKCKMKIMDKDTLDLKGSSFCPNCGEWLNTKEFNGKLGHMVMYSVEPDTYHEFRGKNYFNITRGVK